MAETVTVARTSVFLSDRSQVVRLPKDVAFPNHVKHVTIVREGKRRIVAPADATWDDFFETAGIELGSRVQPEAQDRDAF